jgi:hypothetical protein
LCRLSPSSQAQGSVDTKQEAQLRAGELARKDTHGVNGVRRAFVTQFYITGEKGRVRGDRGLQHAQSL